MSSTYRPLKGDRVFTMDDQPGTKCGQDEVRGTVKELQPNKALIHWDDGKQTWENITDEVIFPVEDEHCDPNWRPIKLELAIKPIKHIP